MTISDELKSNILRYYHVEKWRVGTISSQLSVHHSTVKRVLSDTGVPKENILQHRSMIDPFLSFILDTLQRFPDLTASRLYAMVKARGYPGGIDHFRHLISYYRPRPAAEAYLRLRTLPGEQAQVDWGHFGYVTIGKAKRPLMAFVMVLSYSRKIYLHFYLNQRTDNFLRGHEGAFQAFGGVPRVLLYDNLKSAVLERLGDAIRFNPQLLAFAAHYHFEPRPVAVYRGNEKGRVERAIRYVRDNFFAARTWRDVDDLNSQAETWCNTSAAQRPCPEDKTQSVACVFQAEQPRLLKLPDNPYPVDELETVQVGKTPYIRFDWNDYSVPHTHVRQSLSVQATLDTVTILDGRKVLGQHPRSYDKAQQIECDEHIETLASIKKQARLHRGQSKLIHAIDCSRDFLNRAAAHGYALRGITNQLLSLLDDYGASILSEAMADALARDVPHPNSVRLSLQRIQDARLAVPTVSLTLSSDKRVQELVVKPHPLSDYDLFNNPNSNEDKQS
jgi:transposase